ncbi:MAG TPA: TIR domain-containing protein [Anaerolineae bacterium]|nr:TIR domain-containing protein [Anaerolineae bacterium]
MAHDVFISYSSQDKVVADAVCATLEGRRIRCWIAPRDVPPGLPYAAALVNAINDCKVFVLVLSKGSNTSGQVLREVEEAVDNGTPIIPFRIEDFEPTDAMRYYIKSLHWLDAMSPPLERHLGKLADSVQALLSVGAEEQPPPVAETVMEALAKKRWPLPIWATALLALAVVVIVGGVGWLAISQTRSTPTPSDVSSASESLISKLTDTPVPVVPTTAPTEVPSIQFRDDFENALAEGWTILREVSTHWSLTDNPGSWRVTLQPGTVDGFIPELPTNVLLREAPSGDFEIATLVHFTPTRNYQFAGLIVYQDDQNVVQLGRSYCDRPDTCVDNGIYFDSISDVIESFATDTTNPSIAYLRLRREGTTYTGYYSEDGGNWTIIGQHISNINPLQVGLIAGQALEVSTIADFECFAMEELPSTSSGWSEWRTLTFNIPSETLWRQSGENSYTTIAEDLSTDTFAWSNEIVEGDLILIAEVTSPLSDVEGSFIIYGDGTGYSYGCLFFAYGHGVAKIEKHTPYHQGENWLVLNYGDFNFQEPTHIFQIEIIGDKANFYIDDQKVASAFIPDEINRRGRIGLTQYWEEPPGVTYSNIRIKTLNKVE